ncbi:MAG: lactoylglutathione lyase [Sphingomonadales bacterium]|nr:lactoylglutathione lyase [Sphingomonadales bacterium]MBD3773432.1 lactoylglutathione lyase [Paracoccaceae bacterium]
MTKTIFVNLPVGDLAASMAFYEAIGFTNEPQFTNDMAAGMFWSDAIRVMLLTHDFWKGFTPKAIPDARASAQVLLCLSCDSRAEVDAMLAGALAAGATGDPCPVQDMGFMYGRSFEDPDGHIWELAWIDPCATEHGPHAEATA